MKKNIDTATLYEANISAHMITKLSNNVFFIILKLIICV